MEKIPKRILDQEIYTDNEGRLYAALQDNNTLTLEVQTEKQIEVISFPLEAIPNLIKFLQEAMK